ncbi:MAG: ferritin [Cyanobacteria bacterium SIG28]|nr:ferritin [Cyanobacteria bacterium SIG28]
MISENINVILNEQINKEFYSGYLYLSMSAYLKELGLNGFATWTKIQAKEEVEHGLKIFDYLIDCNSFVTLKQIKTPEFEFNGILSIFNYIYEHEKSITNSIMEIAKKAEEECDRMTLNFIDWFIAEQVEEEETVKNIIKRLELFGEDKVALYLMDKELSERTE